jgi:hypothetical protein
MLKNVSEFEQSLKKYPPIAPGTPDPYTPFPMTGSRALQTYCGAIAVRRLPSRRISNRVSISGFCPISGLMASR